MVSPEILNNDSHFKELWGKKQFTDNLINLVLDEAHVIKEWGGTFRSNYLHIGPIRYLLTCKPTVGIHLGTATMPPDQLPEIRANLHLHEDATQTFRLPTDRPNIFLVVRRMEYDLGSYHNLAFVIKLNLSTADPRPPKFLIFFNSRKEAQEGAKFLWKRLSLELHNRIKWYHSGMTDEFREDEMHVLQIGEEVFGDAATDAVGMVIIQFFCVLVSS